MTTDVHYIDAVLAGDSEAFGQLVRKYQDRLFHTLFRFTGSREEAEDVAQESFVQAFVKLESFQRKSAFYTWLYRIAFNISVSRQRRKRPTISVEQTRLVSGAEPLDPADTAGEVIERHEKVAAVHAALLELSDQHRQIIVLRELEDCDYETMSEILDLPVGTVRSRLHRARQQLRDTLQRSQQLS